jgi:tRNA 2-thiouridine synthesizing protein E
MLSKNGIIIETDSHGYLRDQNDWSEELATEIAKQEQIELNDDHWQVIHFVRDYYQHYKSSPAIRPLVKFLAEKWGPEKGNSLYLHKLFKEPAKQASKIAGLPKPARCI